MIESFDGFLNDGHLKEAILGGWCAITSELNEEASFHLVHSMRFHRKGRVVEEMRGGESESFQSLLPQLSLYQADQLADCEPKGQRLWIWLITRPHCAIVVNHAFRFFKKKVKNVEMDDEETELRARRRMARDELGESRPYGLRTLKK